MVTAIHPDYEQLLGDSVVDVLSTMFFAEAVPQMESSPYHDLDSQSASAEFHGDREGWMWVSLSQGCLRRMVANFLGAETEEDVSCEDLKQVLCELVNMICGSFLSRTDREGSFLIRTPRCPADDGLPPALVTRNYDVEGGTMQVHFAWAEVI